MSEKRNILLTGGTGFLGSNLLKKLVENGFNVFVLLRKESKLSRIEGLVGKVKFVRTDKTEFLDFFSRNEIYAIIHCATNYGRKNESPVDILEANLTLPLKLLQLGTDSGVKCFVNTDTVLDKRVNYYSLSKMQFKDWLRTYSDRMACVNIALEHFYGPDDTPSKFVTWIVQSLIRKANEIELTLGEQKRDFIYIDDVIDAFTLILADAFTREKGFVSYEIGAGQTISIGDFVRLIKKLLGNDSTFLHFGAIPYRENEVMESNVDLSAIEALGWRPAVSLADGLRKTIDFEKRKLVQ